MRTIYYCEDSHGGRAFFGTAATTAAGMARAAMAALCIPEDVYYYYTSEEQLTDVMQAFECTRRSAALYSAMACEGVEVYPCCYIRSAGAYKRHYRPLTLDFDTNEFYC